MTDRDWPSSEFVHRLISQLDEAVRNAERVRRQVEDQLRQRSIYPDRGEAGRWQRITERDIHTDQE